MDAPENFRPKALDGLPRLDCNGCRKCCLGDTITLLPSDNPALYKTKRAANGALHIAKGKDGNCVYLGKRGCQIQSIKPAMCRSYDCRQHAYAVSQLPEAAQGNRWDLPAVAEGRDRLKALGVEVGAHDS